MPERKFDASELILHLFGGHVVSDAVTASDKQDMESDRENTVGGCAKGHTRI